MEAIVSIHDVMPSTVSRVRTIVDGLPDPCRENLILLVVPGLDWVASQLDQLRAWQGEGMVLAGHGWTHQAADIRGVHHRLHSALISRRAAEHLSLSPEAVEALMRRNHAWFGDHDLSAPELYVPPAWAMGRMPRARLVDLPFRYYETTGALIQAWPWQAKILPLAGFEADHRLRQAALGASNVLNVLASRAIGPLRIAIHPFDDEYLLAGQMRRLLERVTRNPPLANLFIA